MKILQLNTVVLFFVLIELTGHIEMSSCGQLQLDHVPLITHAHLTHHWPWHVAVFHQLNGKDRTYECGGTVISSNTILTAAHCVSINTRPMNSSQIAVSLGRLNLSDDNEKSAQWPKVAEIIRHPNYFILDYSNDIAIIKLSTDIKFNKFVQPICLWSANKTDFSEIEGRDGTVVGWGRTETGELSIELREASLSVIPHLACLQSNRDFVGSYLSETSFCAGLRNGTNVCMGDSGGSLTFGENGIYYIRGIVSVSPAKINRTANTYMCDSFEHVIFTDVARYLQWIEYNNCETSAPCERRHDFVGEVKQKTGQIEMSFCGKLQLDHVPLILNAQFTHHWPWHVAVFHQLNGKDITYQCGGTVINSNSILTAAHCVSTDSRPLNSSQIAVSLGRLNLSDDNETSAQWPEVAEIIRHPNYNSLDYSNDIAIIRLSTDVEFNKFVQPICLWSAGKTKFSEIDGREGTIVGWGLTEVGEVSMELREASLSVISHLECLKSNRDFVGSYLSETNFCAGSRNGTNVCMGDSGGAMIFEEKGIYYIRGIFSVGPVKINHTTNTLICDSDANTIFTDVARYLHWIEDNN